MQAIISHIDRCSLHDGPGIRTVVYLKGCSLKCLWCHNPENQGGTVELLHYADLCIHCGRCLTACISGHSFSDGQIVYHHENCQLCQACSQNCPSHAITACGQLMGAEAVLREVLKDKNYYEASGGGVTFSGGEGLLFPEFLREATGLCHRYGISTAVESSLAVPWSAVESLVQRIDLFMVDIKHRNSGEHERLTGRGNSQIMDNILRLSDVHPNVQIRIPLIPGANDNNENLQATADFLNQCGTGVKSVQILKYNPLAAGKYSALGRKYHQFTSQPQDDLVMDQKRDFLRKYLKKSIQVQDPMPSSRPF